MVQPIFPKEEKERIDRSLRKLGVTEEEAESVGKDTGYLYDLDLDGIADLVKLRVLERTDFFLADEEQKKIIYGSVPNPAMELFIAADSLNGGGAYTAFPSQLCMLIGPTTYKKSDAFLEAAEKVGMKRGFTCGVTKAQCGAALAGAIPSRALMVSSATGCDDMSKVVELWGELCRELKIVYLRTGLWTWREKTDEKNIEFLGDEIRRAKRAMEEYMGMKITNEMLWNAIDLKEILAEPCRRLLQLVKESDPIPIRDLDKRLVVYPLFAYTRYIKNFGECAERVYKAAKQRVDQGIGVTSKGAPRILLNGYTPPDHHLIRFLEERDIAISFWEFDIFADHKVDRGYEDPCYAIAKRFARHLKFFGKNRPEELLRLAKENKVDGVLLLNQTTCRAWDPWNPRTQKLIEDELGIPVLIVDFEPLDVRDYTAEGIQKKLEVFVEVLHSRK